MKVKKEYTPLSQEKYNEWKDKTYTNGGSPNIVVPNGALSYTSLNNLKRDTAGWVEHYLRGNKIDLSHLKPIKDGREFADKMEKDEEYQALYPTLEHKEKSLVVAIPCQRMQAMIPLLIKMDACSDDYTKIIDHKRESLTSTSGWSQKKAFSHLQFRLYAMAIWIRFHIIPTIECVVVKHHEGEDTGLYETFTLNYPEYILEQTLIEFETLASKAVRLVQREVELEGLTL